jgi:hypothetical protein
MSIRLWLVVGVSLVGAPEEMGLPNHITRNREKWMTLGMWRYIAEKREGRVFFLPGLYACRHLKLDIYSSIGAPYRQLPMQQLL